MLTNKFTRQLRRAISVCSAVVLVVCSVPGQAKTSTPKVTAMKLMSPLTETGSRVSATLTMKKGSTFRIKTKLFPSSAKKAVLTYKSNKKKVATVSKKGVIKAKKTGKTTITVTPKGNKKVKAVIKVTVEKSLKKVKKIQLNESSLTLSLGNNMNSANLIAKVTSPKKPTNKKIRWISEDSSIASVSKSGLVTAKKAGTTSVIAIAADGQGAKAACRVTVEEGISDTSASPAPSGSLAPSGSATPGVPTSSSPSANTSASPGTVTSSPSQMPSTSASPSSSPAVMNSIDITVPDNRTGIKQGETLQLAAKNPNSGETVTDITWSMKNSLSGVSISESGLLSVTSEASTTLASPKKISITAKLNSDPEITDTVSLSVIENKSVLADNHIKLNEETAESPQGLSYRTADDGTKAYSTVIDPMRGSVTRVDESIGYKNDMIAWLTVNPMYAGKTVHISAYIKYDKLETRNNIGLILNERWNNSNPARKWNAEPDTWHYVTGTYELPLYRDFRYDGLRNNLFLSRFSELTDNEHPVYYLDNVVFSVEKADVENVTLSSEDDTETIYQNHTRQYSVEVTGTKVPIQKVNYEIEPAVENVSISEDGLLKVDNAPAGSVINLKASSIENPEKYDTREITVLAQSIDSIDVSAEGNPTEIYQDNELQFTAEVSSTGEPDESVIWSISPEVSGAFISKDGLLTVGKVNDGTELRITATSVFDPTKKKDYTITVRANEVKSVTVSGIGDEDIISPEGTKDFYVTLDTIGTPSKDVTWSIYPEVKGASLSPKGDRCTLSIDETVTEGTEITVKAVSVFDPSKSGEKTVTVENASSEETGQVIYDENFSTTNSLTLLEQGNVVSLQATKPDNTIWNTFRITNNFPSDGIIDPGTTSNSRAMRSFFGGENDYLQFMLDNNDTKEKSFTLSFMFSFYGVAIDEGLMWNEDDLPIPYNLPLKLVAIDEAGNETTLKSKIHVPFPCAFYNINPEFYEIQSTLNVPAKKKMKVQLKLDGELPICLIPEDHRNAENEPHPVMYTVDNISISTGENKITLNTTDNKTHQLKLNTAPTDKITYYTKSSLAKTTHENEPTSCTNLTHVAEVSESGLITAHSAGVTALIAEIKHSDGSTEQKQFIIQVE